MYSHLDRRTSVLRPMHWNLGFPSKFFHTSLQIKLFLNLTCSKFLYGISNSFLLLNATNLVHHYKKISVLGKRYIAESIHLTPLDVWYSYTLAPTLEYALPLQGSGASGFRGFRIPRFRGSRALGPGTPGLVFPKTPDLSLCSPAVGVRWFSQIVAEDISDIHLLSTRRNLNQSCQSYIKDDVWST